MEENSIWVSLGKALFSLFLSKETEKKGVLKPVEAEVTVKFNGPTENSQPKPDKQVNDVNPLIDWESPMSRITPHFLVGEAITLHSWNRLANADDGLTEEGKQSLIKLCQKLEDVRSYLGVGMNIHCMFRSQKYNQEVVKAIPNDVHAQFMAVDFDCGPSMTIEEVKAKMEPVLESMGLRMEKGTTTWVHLDLRAPGPSGRYFTA